MTNTLARPVLPGGVIRLHVDESALHLALSNAPVGNYPLLEAAFAWHERRPGATPADPSVGPPSRYLPILVTRRVAATRLARLMSTLTWAIVSVAEPGADTAAVEVPAGSYHRVTRALATTWRGRDKLLLAPAPVEVKYNAAAALWRMAILSVGHRRLGLLAVRAATPRGLATLTAAASVLGIRCEPADPGNVLTLLVPNQYSLSLLAGRPRD